MLSIFARFMRGQDASGMMSYALLMGLISTVVLLAMSRTGQGVTLILDRVESGMIVGLSEAQLADFPAVQNSISSPAAVIEGNNVTATIPSSMFSGSNLTISSDAATTAPFLALTGDFVSGGTYAGIIPAAGSYLITITATNAAGSVSSNFTTTADPVQTIARDQTTPIINGQYQAMCNTWGPSGRCDNPQLKLFDSFATACPALPNHTTGPIPVWYTAYFNGSTTKTEATCADFCRIATGDESFSSCSANGTFDRVHGSWRAISASGGCIDGPLLGVDTIEMDKGFSYAGESFQNIQFESRDPAFGANIINRLSVTCDGWQP